MAELTVPPLLAHVPEASPPFRWQVLLIPALLALVGILIATAAAVSGQDLRRDSEQLQIQRDTTKAQADLAAAQLRHADVALLDKLRQNVEKQKARAPSSYTRYGRQFTEWDGWRYEDIAIHGYAYHHSSDPDSVKNAALIQLPGDPEPRLKNVSWYPLYPLLGAGLSKILGISVNAALTIISQLCIVLAAIVMFLYARRHYYNRMPRLTGSATGAAADFPALAEQHPTRRWDLSPQDTAAVWALAALLYGPCSIFLYANYTESMFVLLLAAFLYCLQGRWWWRAALLAALAAACRSQGVLFGPILALVFLFRGNSRHPAAKVGIAILLGAVSALGILGYAIYLQLTFGDFFAFVHAQTYWNVGLHRAQLYTALNPVNALTHLFHYIFYAGSADWPRLWEALCVIWPPIILLILGGRFLSFELEVVGWLLWGLPFVSNSLAGNPPGSEMWMSMGRFMLVLIPAHIIFGAIFARFRWAGIPWLAFWASAFALFAFKFGAGQWIG